MGMLFKQSMIGNVVFLCVTQICFGGRHYITGNGFRNCADYKIESYQCSFSPESIPPKSIVYIETDYLEHFFKNIFPKINNSIILVTHNGDWPTPGIFIDYLNDQRIIMWFGQNCDIDVHPKFTSIPIGIANAKWAHGNTHVFDKVLNHLDKRSGKSRHFRLYINFAATNSTRPQLIQFFKGNQFVHLSSPKPLRKYLLEMARYAFVLSPHGNGLDCHRTWEALLVGCVPVVKTSTLDSLYKDLPIIIVQDWHEITENFLKTQYQRMSFEKYNYEKLFMDYWIGLIHNYRSSYQASCS